MESITETKMPLPIYQHEALGLALKITKATITATSELLGKSYGTKNKSYQASLSAADSIESLLCHLENQSIQDIGSSAPISLYHGEITKKEIWGTPNSPAAIIDDSLVESFVEPWREIAARLALACIADGGDFREEVLRDYRKMLEEAGE